MRWYKKHERYVWHTYHTPLGWSIASTSGFAILLICTPKHRDPHTVQYFRHKHCIAATTAFLVMGDAARTPARGAGSSLTPCHPLQSCPRACCLQPWAAVPAKWVFLFLQCNEVMSHKSTTSPPEATHSTGRCLANRYSVQGFGALLLRLSKHS